MEIRAQASPMGWRFGFSGVTRFLGYLVPKLPPPLPSPHSLVGSGEPDGVRWTVFGFPRERGLGPTYRLTLTYRIYIYIYIYIYNI
jgi:hypothetical protein